MCCLARMDEELKLKGYFSVQQRMLALCGLSLNENQSLLYKLYSWSLFVLFIAYLSILMYDIVVYFDDIDIVTNCLYHGAAIVMGLFKFWIFTFNRRRLNKTLNLLEQGVFAPNKERGGGKEEIWIKECIKNSNILVTAGCVMSMTTISLRVVPSIIKRIITGNETQQWQLPFSKFSLFVYDRSPNFELVWFFQSYAWSMLSMVYVVTDYFIMSVFAHISVQFKILRNSINRIIIDDCDQKCEDREGSSVHIESIQELKLVEPTWEYLADKLRANVRYHLAIIDLAKQLEEILNMFVLTSYIGDTIAFACIMYHGSLYPLSDTRFQRDVTLGLVMSFQLFLITYFGNEVTLESALVLSACFDKKYFGVDIRLQKGLNIIMSRSQRPIKFTIGKFADLSLISFVSLMRASLSYYMVLHRMNQ